MIYSNKIPYYLYSALSFKSVNSLDKQYLSFMNNMTVGYECEVAYEGKDKNINDLKEEFRLQFDYTEKDFLFTLYDVSKFIEDFDVEFKYGQPDKTYAKILESISRIIISGKYSPKILKTPEGGKTPFKDFYSYSHVSIDIFKKRYDIDDFISSEQIIKNFTNISLLLDKFLAKYKLKDPTIKYFKTELEDKIKQLINYVDLDTLYYLLNSVFNLSNRFKVLATIIAKKVKAPHNISIFDEDNNVIFVNIETILDPSNSKFITYSKEKFEEAYKKSYDRKFEEDFTYYFENLPSDSTSAVNYIYNSVLKVDPKAVMTKTYHNSGNFKGKVTVVEPDSSIKPKGAEIVSPILNGLKQSFEWLDKIFDIIDDDTSLNTNSTTGFHVNLGSFTYIGNLDTSKPVIDVLKLALLSGDDYLLSQFDRSNNMFAKSIISNLHGLASENFDFKSATKSGLFDLIKKMNSKFINGQLDRYRTINMQNLMEKNYIEFRIAGNTGYEKDRVKLKKAIYRYAQLCAISCDPQAYFKEYMTELYKLFVSSSSQADILQPKTPLPKNTDEAVIILRSWNSKYSKSGNNPLRDYALDKITKDIFIGQSNSKLLFNDALVLNLLSGIDIDLYSKIDSNFLYSIRILMLYSAKNKSNPKQFLSEFFNKSKAPAYFKTIIPKMWSIKPQWVKFFYTGILRGL